MRLLLVSDLHYVLRQFDWVLEQSGDFDAVVLAGDHLDVGSNLPLESQIVVVRTYLRELALRTTTLVNSGNHDLTGRNEHGEKTADWLAASRVGSAVGDGSTLNHDDLRLTVCPWWDGPLTRDDVARQLDAAAIGRPGRWIWVYHYPPDEAPVSWTGRRHIGDRDLNGWIDQHRPDLVLTGHIHDSPFRDGGSWVARLGESWVINAGRLPGPVPAHVVIDSTSGTADWWSAYGQETRQLWTGAA